jgi:membrane protein
MADESTDEAPQQVSDLPRSATGGVLKRTFREFRDDNLPDLAAALTYYGVLSIFPMIIVIVSVLGLVGHSATHTLIGNLSKLSRPVRRGTSSPAGSSTSSHTRGRPASCSSRG